MGYKTKEEHNKYHREYYYRKKGTSLQDQKLNKIKKLFNKLVEDARKYDIIVESINCSFQKDVGYGCSFQFSSDSIDNLSLETNYS
jgi:hypothetical protein